MPLDKDEIRKIGLGLAGPAIWSGPEPPETVPTQESPTLAELEHPIADLSPSALRDTQTYLLAEVSGTNAYTPNPAHTMESFELKPGDVMIQPDQSRGGFSVDVNATTSKDIDGTSNQVTPGQAELGALVNPSFLHEKEVVDKNGKKEFRGSTAVGETGPKTRKDARKVPRPGEYGLDGAYATLADAAYPSDIITAVVDMLKKSNNYHPTTDSPFIKSNAVDEDEATQGLFTIQRELGRFVVAGESLPDGEALSNPTSGQRVTSFDAAKIGKAQALMATGDRQAAELTLGLAKDSTKTGITDAIGQIGAQLGLFGIDMTALRLDGFRDEFYVKETDKDGVPTIVDPNLTGLKENIPINTKSKLLGATGNRTFYDKVGSESLIERGHTNPYNSTSYGQYNNYLEPFGNGVLLDATGMLVLAAVSVGSLLVVSLIVEVIASAATEEFNAPDRADPRKMRFGSYNPVVEVGGGAGQAAVDFIIEDIFGVTRTDYAFGEALGLGMAPMIGFPVGLTNSEIGVSLTTGQGLVEFAINLVTAPGYYVNWVRQMTIGFQGVMNAFGAITSASSGMEQFFVALDKLTSSKVWRFIMIAAGVGDQMCKAMFGSASNEERLFQLKGADIKAGSLTLDSAIEKMEKSNKEIIKAADAEAAAKKSDGLIKTYQAIASLRQNLTRWGGKKGQPANPLSLSSFIATNVPDARVALATPAMRRLTASPKNIEALEQAINAEYVPFYFHDLRTHEIISVPAFISDFNEDYAVTYNSIASYGRQDPVKIYGGTERNINLTFKLVAFGEKDYDALWYTVNKLVAMCYPQYSKGATRQLETTSNKITFTQPFSQVPAASPLIRIRLGDLFRTNYSTQGVQRLFGRYNDYDKDGKVTPDGGDWKIEGAETVAYKAAVEAAYAKALKKQVDQTKAAIKPAEVESATKLFEAKKLFIKLKKSEYKKLAVINSKATRLLGPGSGKTFKKASQKGNGKKFFTRNGKLKQDIIIEHVPSSGFSMPEIGGKRKVTVLKGTFKYYLQSEVLGSPSKVETTFETDEISIIYGKDLMNIDVGLAHNMPDSVLKKAAEEDADYKKVKDKVGAPDKLKEADEFFNSSNNIIVRSFESTKGAGLAGVITSMGLDYAESTWATDMDKGRAPKSVTITMAFSPMYDLPVGMDHKGRLRALSHPAAIANLTADSAKKAAAAPNFGQVHKGLQSIVKDDKAQERIGDIRKALAKAQTGTDSDEDSFFAGD